MHNTGISKCNSKPSQFTFIAKPSCDVKECGKFKQWVSPLGEVVELIYSCSALPTWYVTQRPLENCTSWCCCQLSDSKIGHWPPQSRSKAYRECLGNEPDKPNNFLERLRLLDFLKIYGGWNCRNCRTCSVLSWKKLTMINHYDKLHKRTLIRMHGHAPDCSKLFSSVEGLEA